MANSSPPGITTFGVNINYATIEEQQELSYATKTNLSLSAANFAVNELSDWDNISNVEPISLHDHLDSPWVESCAMSIENEGDESLPDPSGSDITMDPPFSSQFYCCESRPGKKGYPLGDQASKRLDGIVYPREDASMPGVLDRGRFHVHPVTGGQHAILNAFRPFKREVLIDTCLLRHPHFTIDQWYWRKRAESLGRSLHEYRTEFMRADFSPSMGTPVAERIVLCLTNGVPSNGIGLGNEYHFQCLYHAGEESYKIRDQHLMLRTYLSTDLTEYSCFNVSTWYQRRVDQWMCNKDIVSTLDDDLIRRMENSTIDNAGEQQSVLDTSNLDSPCRPSPSLHHIELNGIEKSRGGYLTLQRNAAITCDFTRMIPCPVVVTVHVEGVGQPV